MDLVSFCPSFVFYLHSHIPQEQLTGHVWTVNKQAAKVPPPAPRSDLAVTLLRQYGQRDLSLILFCCCFKELTPLLIRPHNSTESKLLV